MPPRRAKLTPALLGLFSSSRRRLAGAGWGCDDVERTACHGCRTRATARLVGGGPPPSATRSHSGQHSRAPLTNWVRLATMSARWRSGNGIVGVKVLSTTRRAPCSCAMAAREAAGAADAQGNGRARAAARKNSPVRTAQAPAWRIPRRLSVSLAGAQITRQQQKTLDRGASFIYVCTIRTTEQ